MTEKELEKLYNEAYKAVYWTAMSILKNKEDAEDVVQDTFITAYETYDTLNDKTKAVSWVKKIAANKCLNIVTRKRTVNADDEFLENAEEVPEDFLPDSIVESEEKRKIIMDIINNSLSEDTAMTIILFYFNEMSIKEIAERLNIPQGTVLSRLNYAKKKIKKEVEKYEKDNKDKLFVVSVPFLTLLFEKEAEQVPFVPMPESIKGITASSKAASKATEAATAKYTAAGTVIKVAAIGIAAAAILAAGGFIVYKVITRNAAKGSDVTSAVSSETSEPVNTYATVNETERPINVLGMTPDLLDLQGGYVRYNTYHSISEDTYEEKDQLYYDADGNLVLDCLYNEDGVLIYSDYYIYDDEGRVVREELWDTDSHSKGLYRTYTYGPNGVSRQESGKFGKDPDHYHVYEYDNKDRLILDTEYSTEFGTSYWYCEYVYEDDGTYTTHVTSFDVYRQAMIASEDYNRYTADGTLLVKYTGIQAQSDVYNYDDNGSLLSVERYYGKSLHQTTTYEYDAQGRLVRDYTAFPGRDAHKENTYTYKNL
ncbi:MAG: sigma-70 family RNA polymerase sigma factor [Clostridiales bacterium]|nr:sigma-70 family RNA polymerase sigma factor [Clostridiales bacterium]